MAATRDELMQRAIELGESTQKRIEKLLKGPTDMFSARESMEIIQAWTSFSRELIDIIYGLKNTISDLERVAGMNITVQLAMLQSSIDALTTKVDMLPQ